MRRHFLEVCLFGFLIMLFPSCSERQVSGIKNDYYQQLDKIRDTKHRHFDQYMQHVQSVAKSIQTDPIMGDLFDGKMALYRAYKNETPTEEVKFARFRLRDAIEDRYIENYLIFSDILFITPDGDIFYTIRRQTDYHKNIFGKELSDTSLSRNLRENPTETFVDFQTYKISGEPAAFFVEPKFKGTKMAGWYVLQFSIKKINEMFSVDESLGKTGEVFLVNKDCYMLTDSRFFPDSTSMKMQLSEQNINEKFKERTGHKLVTDYRGFSAISSFEVISLLGSEWLLIAKIDEDELLTEAYKSNKEKVFHEMVNLAVEQSGNFPPSDKDCSRDVEVAIDEYKRATGGEILYTHGVSTCTAFIISQKGEFAYLAHISAFDWLYGSGQTDIVRGILKRIDKFDVVQNDKRTLQIALISPSLPDTEKLVDALVEWGVFLSQIKLVSNPGAKYANVSHDYGQGETIVEWKMKDNSVEKIPVTLNDLKTLGDLFKMVKI